MSKRLHATKHRPIGMKGPPPWTGRSRRRRALRVAATGFLVYLVVVGLLALGRLL